MSQDVDQISKLFQVLAEAIRFGATAIFAKIAASPGSAVQQQLFLRNSKSLRAARLHLKLRQVQTQGAQATATFDVVDDAGVAHDEGEIAFRRVGSRWLVDEL